MIVYRVSYSDAHEENVYSWWKTKREAEKEKKIFLRLIEEWGEAYTEVPEIHRLIIPTTKDGLVNWLNDNLVRDNG